jgi:thiamine biosynthesis lipoprotein
MFHFDHSSNAIIKNRQSVLNYLYSPPAICVLCMQRAYLYILFFLPLTLFSQADKYRFTTYKMGTECNIVIADGDSTLAARIANGAWLVADSLIHIFSDYDETSELNRINRMAGKASVRVSADMMHLVRLGLKVCALSDGTFSIAMGPLSRVWRQARRENRLPQADTISMILSLCDCRHVVIDTLQSTIFLTRPGMALDMGGIAKGYIAQRMLDYISASGVCCALVDAGGDICVSDGSKQPWRIAVNLPAKTDEYWQKNILLRNKAIATSGDAYQHLIHEGTRYSHIIDPSTGYGTVYSRNVTVLASDGATADWLATACSILPLKKAKKLAEKMGAQLLIASNEKGKTRITRTKYFPSTR